MSKQIIDQIKDGLAQLKHLKHKPELVEVLASYPLVAEYLVYSNKIANATLLKQLNGEQSKRLLEIREEVLQALDKNISMEQALAKSRKFQDLLRKAQAELLEIFPAKPVLNIDGTLFQDKELEELYQRYGKGQGRLTWAKKQKETRAARILETALGTNWRERLGKQIRIVDLSSIPAPSALAVQKYEELLLLFQKQMKRTGDEDWETVLAKVLYGEVWKKNKIPTKIPRINDIKEFPNSASSTVNMGRLSKLLGNLGEALVLQKQLDLLAKHVNGFKRLKWKIGKQQDVVEIAYYPQLTATYKKLDSADVSKAKQTTDGAIIVTLKGKPPRYKFIDYNEVKSGQLGAEAGFDQLFERGEFLDDVGFLGFKLKGRRYIFNKGTDEIVEEALDNPISLVYEYGSRLAKKDDLKEAAGTIHGFHSARKRLYAADDRLDIDPEKWDSEKTAGRTYKPEGFGLDQDDIFTLAAYLLAYGSINVRF